MIKRQNAFLMTLSLYEVNNHIGSESGVNYAMYAHAGTCEACSSNQLCPARREACSVLTSRIEAARGPTI